MTKEEKIKEAWGENWSKISKENQKKALKNNGFVSQYYEDLLSKETICRKLFDVRPKSLQGIENNNGWIKGNEPNVPNESYFVFAFGGIYETFYDEKLGWLYVNREFVTHFQPIEKPKPPIY
ncbi:hypothetical protein [Algoriella sp.]|uniref:hypothetical protein n=1 Tax=Algoriella sp. TaxID=1872434 RepID=UPI002FC7DA6C